jgi:hypothetical protein
MGTDEECPPLFVGEPERCALCGKPGHTHDDHWLFQLEPVKALEKRLEYERRLTGTLRRVMKDEQRASRQAFIRQAAVAIYVQGMTVPDKPHGVVTFQPSTCWKAAAELWAAKPEDC